MVYDIFLSYPRVEQDRAHALVAALTALGLSVWVDRQRIDDGAPITQSIVEGLARSRVLLAWYAPAYARSRACQWELTAAYLATQHEGGKIGQRLLIVNPAEGAAHVEQTHLLDCQHLSGQMPVAELAERVRDAVDRILPPFTNIRALTPPPWPAGPRRSGSNRFVGRLRELWGIHNGLIAGDLAIISGKPAGNDLVRVHGMGGIGKSLLAEEYALRFGAAYSGGIFWLSASPPDSRTTPEQQYQSQMLNLAQRLGMEIAGQPFPVVQGMLRRHLEGVGCYLWLVDDLPGGAGADVLRHWLAPTGNGRTLITSRSGGWSGNGQAIPLEQLDDDAAFELLTSRRPPRAAAEMAAAREILRLLGNHALAVDVTGAALKGVSYVQMLGELKNPTQDALDLAAKMAKDLPNGHEASVAATLLHSVTRLEADAQQLLQLVSLLAVEPIPRDFVLSLLAALKGGEVPSPLAALLPLDAAADEGLLERVDDDTIAAHILVTRTIRLHQPARDEMRRVVVEVMIGVMRDATDIRHHRRLIPLLPHALALVNGVEDIGAAALSGCLGWFERTRGYYASAVILFQSEWGIRSKLQGEYHVDTLTSMSNLGLSLLNKGELSKARAIQEVELELCRKACGDSDEKTLISVSNLAETLRAQGDFAAARALQEATLTILEHTMGPENQFTLTMMGNLAGTLWLQGNLDDALRIHKNALKIQNTIFDNKEHVDIMTSMFNIANIYCSKGNFNQAKVLYEKVRSVWVRDFGEEHPFTLNCSNGLAEALRFMGDLDKSLALHRAILPVRVRRQGVGHPETIDSMCNLACALWQSNKKEEAISLQSDALDLASNILGLGHPRTQQFANILQQMRNTGSS